MSENLKLRLRFYSVCNKSTATIKKEFEDLKATVEPDYKIKMHDNHIWFTIDVLKREKYSPHLHIEMEEMEDGNTAINGLYGPDPVLWTFFMFLHFIIAGIFTIFSIIAYSKWNLNQKIFLDVTIMTAMVIFWFALYFFARYNRKRGIPQMEKLDELMKKVITT